MKLYLLENPHQTCYGGCEAVVVVAPDEPQARRIHPLESSLNKGSDPWSEENVRRYQDHGSGLGEPWAKTPEEVQVQYLGEAAAGVEAGIVLMSRNDA